MQSLSTQLFAFGITMLVGFIVGILFDTYRIARGVIKPKKIFTYFGDIIFWLISTLLIFVFLLLGNWGEVRFYVFLALVLGSGLYIKLCSAIFLRFMLKLVRIFRTIKLKLVRLVLFLYRTAMYPLCLISNMVVIPIGFFSQRILIPLKREIIKRVGQFRRLFRKEEPPA